MSVGEFTPAQRTLRARLAAFEMHARHDPLETTAKARATFIQSFIDQVDPDRVLPEAERLRRAESARRAFYTRMALQRSRNQAAKKKKAATEHHIPVADPLKPAEEDGRASDQLAAD